jgi:hypothetical protein
MRLSLSMVRTRSRRLIGLLEQFWGMRPVWSLISGH